MTELANLVQYLNVCLRFVWRIGVGDGPSASLSIRHCHKALHLQAPGPRWEHSSRAYHNRQANPN